MADSRMEMETQAEQSLQQEWGANYERNMGRATACLLYTSLYPLLPLFVHMVKSPATYCSLSQRGWGHNPLVLPCLLYTSSSFLTIYEKIRRNLF